MLSILMLLVAEPDALAALASASPPQVAQPQSVADMPVLGQASPGCPVGSMLTRGSQASAEDLLWRDGDPPVGVHLLLDRRIGGCPAPIVVGYRQPGSTAPAADRAPDVSLSRRLAD